MSKSMNKIIKQPQENKTQNYSKILKKYLSEVDNWLIQEEMNKYSKMNEGDNTCQSVWSMVQAILRGKIIALILSFEKLENSQIKTF